MISSKPCYVPTTTSSDQQSCFWNGNDRDDARPGTETTSTSIHSRTHNISLMMAMHLLLRRFAGKYNHSYAFSSFDLNNKKTPQEKHQMKKRRKTTKKRGEHETIEEIPRKNEKKHTPEENKQTIPSPDKREKEEEKTPMQRTRLPPPTCVGRKG